MMMMLLLYAYCFRIVSSRKVERAFYEDLAFRVLTGNQQPDHSRISDFRSRVCLFRACGSARSPAW